MFPYFPLSFVSVASIHQSICSGLFCGQCFPWADFFVSFDLWQLWGKPFPLQPLLWVCCYHLCLLLNSKVLLLSLVDRKIYSLQQTWLIKWDYLPTTPCYPTGFSFPRCLGWECWQVNKQPYILSQTTAPFYHVGPLLGLAPHTSLFSLVGIFFSKYLIMFCLICVLWHSIPIHSVTWILSFLYSLRICDCQSGGVVRFKLRKI